MSIWRIAAVLAVTVSSAAAQGLPNPAKTPGVVEPKLTQERICAPGFDTKSWRHVSAGLKNKVYRAYNMAKDQGDCAIGRGCEVDHLIPLELGGSNDIRNLWIQPYSTKVWNATMKDSLENELHRLVCRGDITLEQAQQEIRSDWTKSWDNRIGKFVR